MTETTTSTTPTTSTTIPTADLAGHVVLWDFSASGNEISYSDVQDALTVADLDPEMAKELRPAAAFSRAAKGLKEERRIDKVSQKKGIVKFQLTRVANDGEEIDFSQETWIELDSSDGSITCRDGAIQQQARDLFAQALKVRTNNDLTKLCQKLFLEQADLFPIVPDKGVAYFVPVAHAAFLEKVRQFAQACGGKLFPFPVPKGSEIGDRSVKHTIAEGLRTMTSELSAVVDEWDATTRASTEEKAVKRWEAISYKVEAYAAYLDDERAKLNEELTLAKTRLVAKIMEVETAKEAAKAAKDGTTPTATPAVSAPATKATTATPSTPATQAPVPVPSTPLSAAVSSAVEEEEEADLFAGILA